MKNKKSDFCDGIGEVIKESKKIASQPTKKKPTSDNQHIYDRKDNTTMGWWPCDSEDGYD